MKKEVKLFSTIVDNNIMNSNTRLILAIIALISMILAACGCNSSGGSVDPPNRDTYELNGAVVKDLNVGINSDTTLIALKAFKDGNSLNNADISFFGQDLTYSIIPNSASFGYIFPTNNQAMIGIGNYILDFADSTHYDDTINVMVVDTFRVSAYNPDSTTVNLNGQQVVIEWTSSANIEGYIVAVTPADSAYTGYGWSEYVTTQTTQITIPPDAFRTPNFPNNLITGTYYLYVYGFTGAPDSALSSTLLPVPLPSQLGDNIDHTNLSGNIGVVVITKRVPLEVTAG